MTHRGVIVVFKVNGKPINASGIVSQDLLRLRSGELFASWNKDKTRNL